MKSVRKNLDVGRLQQSAQYYKERRDMLLYVGDLVLLSTHSLSDAVKRFAATLANRLQGPYSVSARVSPLSFRLVHCETGDECGPIDIKDLKRFFDISEDLHISQIPVNADPASRPVISSPVHRYNLRPRH